jgi:hypothetical protein
MKTIETVCMCARAHVCVGMCVHRCVCVCVCIREGKQRTALGVVPRCCLIGYFSAGEMSQFKPE